MLCVLPSLHLPGGDLKLKLRPQVWFYLTSAGSEALTKSKCQQSLCFQPPSMKDRLKEGLANVTCQRKKGTGLWLKSIPFLISTCPAWELQRLAWFIFIHQNISGNAARHFSQAPRFCPSKTRELSTAITVTRGIKRRWLNKSQSYFAISTFQSSLLFQPCGC